MNQWASVSTALFLLACVAPQRVSGQPSQLTQTEFTVELLTQETGGQALAGSANDPFMAKLFPREVAAMTGVARGHKSVAESRQFAQAFFRDAVLEFTDAEAKVINSIVTSLNSRFGDQYPLLIRRSWRFIKTRKDLCGGFSFTRGNCIAISEPTIDSIAKAFVDPNSQERGEVLFLHEQMHVLQRERPELFSSLYQDVCGFRPARVNVSSWVNERQVTNPDGLNDNWVFDINVNDQTKTYWIGTILRGDKPLHRMGRDFHTIAVQVRATDSGFSMADEANVATTLTPLAEMTEITTRLPLPPSYDHVNEVGAYLFTSITHNRPQRPRPLSQRAAEVFERSKLWFAKNFNRHQKDITDENQSGT